MSVLNYPDLIGFRMLGVYHYMFLSIGVHSERGVNDEVTRSAKGKKYFGNFMLLITFFQGYSSFIAAYNSLKQEDFRAVTNVMAYLSVTLSCFSKFQVARSHANVIHRLGVWMVEVKSKRDKDMEQPKLEALVLRVNKSFFYFGMMSAAVWCSVPLTRNLEAFIPTKYPYLDEELSNRISFPLVQIPIYIFLTVTVVYMATTLLHILAVFCTEVTILSKKWSQVKYDSTRPGLYMEAMKDCIEQHIKLLDVMQDLNVIHDSMFAFQVMIFIIHFVSFNFCIVMTSSSNAFASLFPLTMSSMIEFGLLCWMGEEITHALQSFRTSIYMTNWYTARTTDKKNMVMVLEVLKKRHVLTGAKVFVASLDTFVDAAKQSFSLYTLMKALTSNE